MACWSALANDVEAVAAVGTVVLALVDGASTPPLGVVLLPIIEDGSAISCLIAPTRTSVDSIDITRVIGR